VPTVASEESAAGRPLEDAGGCMNLGLGLGLGPCFDAGTGTVMLADENAPIAQSPTHEDITTKPPRMAIDSFGEFGMIKPRMSSSADGTTFAFSGYNLLLPLGSYPEIDGRGSSLEGRRPSFMSFQKGQIPTLSWYC